MTKIFISYIFQEALEETDILESNLRKIGYEVQTLDLYMRNNGEAAKIALQRAIGFSDFVIILVTSSAFDSTTIAQTIEYAEQLRKPILPIVIGKVQLPERLSHLQFLDMNQYNEKDVIFKISKIIPGQLSKSRLFTRVNALWGIIVVFLSLLFAFFALLSELDRRIFFCNLTNNSLPSCQFTSDVVPLSDITATLNAILTDFITQTAVAQALVPSDIPPPSPTSTPTDDLTATVQAQMTLDAQATAHSPTNTPQPTETSVPSPTIDVGATRTATAEIAIAATQARLDAIATIRVENATAFANIHATETQQGFANLTLTASAAENAAIFATFVAGRHTATAWAVETQERANDQAATQNVLDTRATSTAISAQSAAAFATLQAQRGTETAIAIETVAAATQARLDSVAMLLTQNAAIFATARADGPSGTAAAATQEKLNKITIILTQNAQLFVTSRADRLTATAEAVQGISRGAELTATQSARQTQEAEAIIYEIELPAYIYWKDTGIVVQEGQQISISYISGTWGPCAECFFIGNGSGAIERSNGVDAPYGSLIGRIGLTGETFLIGNFRRFRSEVRGTLYLSINDIAGTFNDNRGSIIIIVKVTE